MPQLLILLLKEISLKESGEPDSDGKIFHNGEGSSGGKKNVFQMD